MKTESMGGLWPLAGLYPLQKILVGLYFLQAIKGGLWWSVYFIYIPKKSLKEPKKIFVDFCRQMLEKPTNLPFVDK